MPIRRLLLAGALGLAGCQPKPAPEPVPSQEAAAPATVAVGEGVAIATAPVAQRKLHAVTAVLGQISARPEGESLVHAPVEAQIVAVYASVGDRVHAGQALAAVRSMRLNEAQAAYLLAHGRHGLERARFERTHRLFDQALASKQELEEGRSALESAKLQLAEAAEGLRVLGFGDAEAQALARRGRVAPTTVLRASGPGTVAERHATIGAVVAPADPSPLFRVLDLSKVRIEADVPERDLARVRRGQAVTVTVSALGDRPLTGVVAAVAPTIEAASRSGRALVDVPNPDGALKPGMSCRVAIDTGWRSALAVPASAVLEEAGRRFAFVPAGPGRYREATVTLGAADGDWREVASGLRAGEAVVVKGAFDLFSEARKADFGGE